MCGGLDRAGVTRMHSLTLPSQFPFVCCDVSHNTIHHSVIIVDAMIPSLRNVLRNRLIRFYFAMFIKAYVYSCMSSYVSSIT